MYVFKIISKTININNNTSFINDSHGVNGMAFPKQPQSVTLLKLAEYHVKNVKKIINNRNSPKVKFRFHPISNAMPNKISKTQIPIPNGSESGMSNFKKLTKKS